MGHHGSEWEASSGQFGDGVVFSLNAGLPGAVTQRRSFKHN